MTGIGGLPTGLPGRALALAILAMLAGLAFLAIVVPLIDIYHRREVVLADRQLLVPKLDQLAADVPALRKRLNALQAAGAANEVTLDGASDALASANLQSHVEQLATANGVTMTSTEAIAAEDRGPYRRIGLRLAVNGKYEFVVKLLAAIEETKPPLVLGALQIHGLFRAVEARAGYPLETQFEVFGLRLARSAAPAQ